MNKLKLLPIFLILIVLSLSFVIAQEAITDTEELPEDPGITPDSALWGIDRALEKIALALTFDNSAKAQKGLRHAHERLLEVKAMIEEDKLDDAAKAELAHEKTIVKVRVRIDSLKEGDEDDIGDITKLENSLDSQEAELDDIRLKVKIKIEGQLTEEQRAKLFAFLESISGNIDELKLEIENKQERTKIKIKEKTGKSEIEIEDSLGKIREKRKVKADVFDDFSKVKVELRFTINASSKEEVIKHILEKFPLTEEEANNLLKIKFDDDDDEEVEICHIPPGNPEEAHTIIIGVPAVSTHLAHGDFLGHCDNGLNKSELRELREQQGKPQISNDPNLQKSPEDDDKKERLRIKAEIKEKHGVSFAKVRIKLEFIDGTDRKSIVNEIAIRTQLTEKEILNAIEFKQKDEDDEDKGKREIEVEIEDNIAEVEIEWLGKKMEFKLKTTNKKVILTEIAVRLGVPVEELVPFVEFEIDDDDGEDKIEDDKDEERKDLIEFEKDSDEDENGDDDEDEDDEDDNDNSGSNNSGQG